MKIQTFTDQQIKTVVVPYFLNRCFELGKKNLELICKNEELEKEVKRLRLLNRDMNDTLNEHLCY
jgi:hypothetical protein|tara:strand:+ start:295 stop:489 length:195 start_codon:yes stop_codon:yes gene_type:complete